MPCSDRSPIYALQRSPSLIDYAGHLAGVLFTTGCNFRCGFCHNAALLAEKKPGMAWPELTGQCERWRSEWVDGVVVSGGEPTLADDLPEFLAWLKAFGFAVKLDTNGSRPEILRACIDTVDYVAMDIKTGLSDYADLTGYADTGSIRASVKLIRERAADYEFRTTVIGGHHTNARMRDIARLIGGASRYVLQPFVPRETVPAPAFRALPRVPRERLDALAAHVRDAVGDVQVRG